MDRWRRLRRTFCARVVNFCQVFAHVTTRRDNNRPSFPPSLSRLGETTTLRITMADTTKTITTEHTIERVLGDPLKLVVTVPTAPADDGSRTPITLFVDSAPALGRHPSVLASLSYAVPSKRSDHVHCTALQDPNNDFIGDVTRQIATLVASKFRRPCYAGCSTGLGLDFHQLAVVKGCVETVGSCLSVSNGG